MCFGAIFTFYLNHHLLLYLKRMVLLCYLLVYLSSVHVSRFNVYGYILPVLTYTS